ncbi:Sodium/glucose cotransporter [Novipirellula artificiosorum]|uniref:Sodium/glucose cotransporter n=1 Tax=Novipirellula artificiosorum TaxID=2528016 RepID=A0A5C6D4N5_9BACT|nr:Sodium/glucose cotransporter [Novipirellula artificiosorum]
MKVRHFYRSGIRQNSNMRKEFWRIPLHRVLLALALTLIGSEQLYAVSDATLDWRSLPALPNEIGVAGPFVGVHQDVLIVAGGANFARPVWESEKQWHDQIDVLQKTSSGYKWIDGGKLPRPMGYGATVSTSDGVVCMGGNDAGATFDAVFALQWDTSTETVRTVDYPSLPRPCAYGQATLVGNVIFLAGGQSGSDIASAMNNFWSLDLSQKNNPDAFVWRELSTWSDEPRAFNITATQHNGYEDCVYVISGRRPGHQGIEFLRDVWQYTPRTDTWQPRQDVPRSMCAGTGIGFGQSHLFVLAGDDGALFDKTDELKDEHPGFPKEAFAFHTITDTWTSLGATPSNQVTTTAARWNDRIVIASGEVRPRVRTPAVWSIAPVARQSGFGVINYIVLGGYLLTMVGVGVYFARKNKTTDDYFRGGKSIPWWAAGCSIFATMLSSLTFTGLPSKAYAQDWVYAVGNLMIPVIAIVAVFVALPFYRRIDATSAYEYLEKRFNRSVRLFGSTSFAMFHLFRMAVVMSLTGLALAVATPLTPAQSVLLMGLLSIAYSTMGGIEAVIWTDTIQTVVLLGGAVLALFMLLSGSGGEHGFGRALQVAFDSDKLRLANLQWQGTGSQVAFWVIVLGAAGHHLSSYTADQAVVQRYMTTSSEKLAARSIWTNAVLSIPATLLFFAIGTALFMFYQSHPERLDPTITTDQIFPLFIAREMPIGIAGLVVAGVFSAAQSTVSTSMNSMATTIVTDFLRPLGICTTDRQYLRAARLITFSVGVLGTVLGLFFIAPEITSLFDTFIKVVGLFMGMLGGLFLLGVLTRRANAYGAFTGAVVGALVMCWLFVYSSVNGYLYITIGMSTCIIVGYLVSCLVPSTRDLSGLTIFTLDPHPTPSRPTLT